KAGRTPGFPRFKGRGRFDTVEWPKDGDGCRWGRIPVVVPIEGSRVPVEVLETSGSRAAAGEPSSTRGPGRLPGFTPTPTLAMSRQGEPSGGGTPVPDAQWQTRMPSPTSVRTTQQPPPDDPETCTNKRGKEKPCKPTKGPTQEPSPTNSPPKPTISISQVPEWGDGESPEPTPSPPDPTLSDTPPA
ncbi:hypothetical protein AB0B89_25800, partial [Sphaerisporangium sp. NPDC049002]